MTKATTQHKIQAVINNRRYRAAVLALLGDVCIRCGFSDPRALQVDHVDGGGFQSRKIGQGISSSQLLNAVIKDPDKFQLLCANCNWIKRVENKEFGIK